MKNRFNLIAFLPFFFMVWGFHSNNFIQAQTIDIAIQVSANQLAPPIYSYTTFSVVVTNESDQTATGLEIATVIPDDWIFNAHSVTSGDFILKFEKWTIQSLEAGASETLNIRLFSLTPDSQETNFFTQVIAADQPDKDSTPNNGSHHTANEDDEAVIKLNERELLSM